MAQGSHVLQVTGIIAPSLRPMIYATNSSSYRQFLRFRPVEYQDRRATLAQTFVRRLPRAPQAYIDSRAFFHSQEPIPDDFESVYQAELQKIREPNRISADDSYDRQCAQMRAAFIFQHGTGHSAMGYVHKESSNSRIAGNPEVDRDSGPCSRGSS